MIFETCGLAVEKTRIEEQATFNSPSMSRLEQAFAKARSENRAAFVAYLCAGDPDFETSVEAARAILANGVDVLELGVPFSDPLADGLTNQLAAQRALESGATSERVLDLVRAIREFSEVPLVFYTYYNLVFSQGSDSYAERAKAAGVDGLLTLDLPPEEASEHLAACTRHGLGTVFIVAPTTPNERLEIISKATTGFVYYVSREGVTGEQASMSEGIRERVDVIKNHTDLPVVVGFGISNADHVKTVAQAADGVVVGSAIVNCIAENLGDSTAITSALEAKMQMLLADGALNKLL